MTIGEIIAFMAKAWLFTPDQGRLIQGVFQLVFNREQASEMTNGDAQQLMRAAEKDPNLKYTWEMIRVGDNSFIVEGTERKAKQKRSGASRSL